MWYFKQRKLEREKSQAQAREAESALNQSRAGLEQVEDQKAKIFDLADRLKTVQIENHWAERLRSAYGK